jgi:hypothetical protein
VIEAPFAVGKINQVALVVRDLDAVVRAYWDRLRIGPWQIYTYRAPLLKEMTYRGRRQDYSMRLAFTWCADLQLEVIQPLEGPTIYEEFLRDHGEGMHHLGIFASDFDASVRDFESRGYTLVQSGRGFGKRGDGAFAYFETEGPLRATLELISPPAERHAPEAVYPPQTR